MWLNLTDAQGGPALVTSADRGRAWRNTARGVVREWRDEPPIKRGSAILGCHGLCCAPEQVRTEIAPSTRLERQLLF
jgi:hypothetical protein